MRLRARCDALVRGVCRVGLNQPDAFEWYAELFCYELLLRGEKTGSKFALSSVCRDHAIGSDGNPCVQLITAGANQNVDLLHSRLGVEIDRPRDEPDNQRATGGL